MFNFGNKPLLCGCSIYHVVWPDFHGCCIFFAVFNEITKEHLLTWKGRVLRVCKVFLITMQRIQCLQFARWLMPMSKLALRTPVIPVMASYLACTFVLGYFRESWWTAWNHGDRCSIPKHHTTMQRPHCRAWHLNALQQLITYLAA